MCDNILKMKAYTILLKVIFPRLNHRVLIQCSIGNIETINAFKYSFIYNLNISGNHLVMRIY